jgi:xanthine/uracil permease
MRAVQGAIIASSILHIVLGFSGLWGILTRFISPVVIAPTIIMVGFGHFEYGFPGVGKCIEIGLPQMFVIILFSQVMVTA